ncbi:hypothetical protein KHF85_05705 [Xanthomonas translucens pv. graminis]|uniref:hypothetical protein n=1 Tax=Xanthomonas graminis TaxID=3390026 RepID=UPI00254167CA|nr:hypothetical protein [Xanthomonas translucens]WIH05952.1 hypothetical protein KHF85_05705 [Xanthomonas translucens pv. graminis]
MGVPFAQWPQPTVHFCGGRERRGARDAWARSAASAAAICSGVSMWMSIDSTIVHCGQWRCV